MDALDRPIFKRFSREQKMAFAKQKSEEELSSTLGDSQKVKTLASKFEETIRRQRIAAGLKG